jgi:uncharacterized protein (DUF4415 family)
MTANEKSTKGSEAHKRTLPTLDDVDAGRVSLDEYEIAHGEDAPELTGSDFDSALPSAEVPVLKEILERARGKRGPQKAPVKERVGLRLDREVLDYFRRTGPGWQGRINDALHTLGPASEDLRPVVVACDSEFVSVSLADGRQIRVPLWWYPFLAEATPEQRSHVELEISGVWWPDLDEGLSVKGLLLGIKAPGAKAPGKAA